MNLRISASRWFCYKNALNMLMVNSVEACMLGTVSNSMRCQLQNRYTNTKFKQADCHFQTYPSK
jgi:hypothetical protein